MIRKLKKPKSIKIQVYISPILYEDSKILSSVELKKKKSVSKNNPSGIINGPLSGPGEELGNPIKEEYERFVDDCKFGIETIGCEIICSKRIDVSDKLEHILLFGTNNKPYRRTLRCHLSRLAAVVIYDVFSVFLFAPRCKLGLTFRTFVIGLDHRQQTAGDSFNGEIWDLHATVFLTAEFLHLMGFPTFRERKSLLE